MFYNRQSRFPFRIACLGLAFLCKTAGGTPHQPSEESMQNKLNRDFGLPGRIEFFEGEGNTLSARLRTGDATVEISLSGALVTRYTPAKGAQNVFWMGDYLPGRDRDVWGGVLLCWPWFGTGKDHLKQPFHGFARWTNWAVIGTETPSDQITVLRLGLTDTDFPSQPYPVHPEYRIELGKSLKISLRTQNKGDEPFLLEQAFHTYFHVGDVTQVQICGLEGARGKSGVKHFIQDGPLIPNGVYSGLFEGVGGDCVIVDPVLNRSIRIRKSGCRQAIVWNSGPVRKIQERTTGEPGWQTQLAVEQVVCLDDAYLLPPGETVELSAEFIVE
jgi:glucose-6-phosphate 1-epimerase